ncbi:hypothetical protein H9W95_06550 [Flavobacterium lindanitolerans]|nr:hypothetical protein [Flavobacterium lindanitolerans]
MVNCPSEPLSFELVVTPQPEFHFTQENTRICFGQETTLKVVPDNFEESEADYIWRNENGGIVGGNSAEIEINEPGLYSVLVNVNNCTFSKSVQVDENTDTFSVGAQAKCENEHYMLTAFAIDNSFNESNATYTGQDQMVLMQQHNRQTLPGWNREYTPL